jgi:hypothetical protein
LKSPMPCVLPCNGAPISAAGDEARDRRPPGVLTRGFLVRMDAAGRRIPFGRDGEKKIRNGALFAGMPDEKSPSGHFATIARPSANVDRIYRLPTR